MDRKEIIALLVNKGISVKEDITDADLKAALNEALGGKAVEPKTNGLTAEDITKAVDAAIKPLQDQLNANSDKELNKAVADVVAMNKGIDEAAAKAMGLTACTAFLAANGQPAIGVNGGHQQNNQDSELAALPE